MRRLLLSIGVAGAVLALPASALATPPSVTSVSPLSANPNNNVQVVFRVVFGEPVTGVDLSDFTLASYLIEDASLGYVAPGGDGTSYDVYVNTGNGDGLLSIDVLDDDTIANAGSEKLATDFTDGPVYLIDKTAPTVTIEQAAGQADPAKSQPLRYTMTFSEPVEGFEVTDVLVDGPDGELEGSLTATSDRAYALEVSGFTAPGAVAVSVEPDAVADAAGNGFNGTSSGDNSVTLAGPTPTLTMSVVDFGDVPHSPTAAPVYRALTVTNTGAFPLSVTSATAGRRAITATRGACTTAIAPGASCDVHVAFAPRTLGRHDAIVEVRTNGGTVSAAASGNAVRPQAPPPPVDTQAPGIVLKTTSLRLNRNGSVRLPLYCAESGSCVLGMRLHTGRVTLAKRTATVLGLRDLKVTLRLSPGAARRVQRAGRRGLRTTLRITATDARGNRKLFRFPARVRRV